MKDINENMNDFHSSESSSPADKEVRKKSKSKGDYIDFEEVK